VSLLRVSHRPLGTTAAVSCTLAKPVIMGVGFGHRNRCRPTCFQVGDGHNGLPEHGPFDAIHVGAAAEEVPQVGGAAVNETGGVQWWRERPAEPCAATCPNRSCSWVPSLLPPAGAAGAAQARRPARHPRRKVLAGAHGLQQRRHRSAHQQEGYVRRDVRASHEPRPAGAVTAVLTPRRRRRRTCAGATSAGGSV
jgi:hypothetical protein